MIDGILQLHGFSAVSGVDNTYQRALHGSFEAQCRVGTPSVDGALIELELIDIESGYACGSWDVFISDQFDVDHFGKVIDRMVDISKGN